MSAFDLIELEEEFDRLVFEPLRALAAERGGRPVYVAIDTETTRIDPARGYNPFYGPRICMGSLSWNGWVLPDETVPKFNVAWCQRMKPGLLARPDWKVGSKEQRAEGKAAMVRYFGQKDEAGTYDLAEFPEWMKLEVEAVLNIAPDWIVRRLIELTRLGIIWIFKNAKFDLLMFDADGFRIVNVEQVEDAEILSHLTEDKPWVKNKRVSHKLQELAKRHLGRDPEASNDMEQWFMEMMKIPNKLRDYSGVPKWIIGKYAAQDTRDTLDLFIFFSDKIIRMDAGSNVPGSMQRLYRDEMSVLHSLVYHTIIPGLPIRQDKADEALVKYGAVRDEHTVKLHELTGRHVDWSSPDETAAFLFDPPTEGGLGLKIPETGWTKTGKRASDKYTLKALENPIATEILKWREANTFVTSFLDPIARFNHGGFIHPDFWLTTARTGRMSASHPNMQNRPKDPAIREIFVPRVGYVLMCFDLDQIEMRITAHFAHMVISAMQEFSYRRWWQGKPGRWLTSTCESAPMWDGFINDADYDPHQRFADETGLPRHSTKSGEKTVKNANFSILFGIGIKKLAQDFNWTREQAKGYKSGWRRAYPEVQHLMNFIAMLLDDRGWIANSYGRRYYIDPDKAYLGLNYVVQGSAADLIKRSLSAVYRVMLDLREEIEGPQPMYIDNIVHDEIVTEVREDLLTPRFARRINEAVVTHKRDNSPIFSVPITASCEVSDKDWGAVKPYAID